MIIRVRILKLITTYCFINIIIKQYMAISFNIHIRIIIDDRLNHTGRGRNEKMQEKRRKGGKRIAN